MRRRSPLARPGHAGAVLRDKSAVDPYGVQRLLSAAHERDLPAGAGRHRARGGQHGWDFLGTAESEEDVARERRKPKVREQLRAVSDREVWAEIQAAESCSSEKEKRQVAELETLLAVSGEAGQNRPNGVFFAGELEKSAWDEPWMRGVEKVVLVHRLRNRKQPEFRIRQGRSCADCRFIVR